MKMRVPSIPLFTVDPYFSIWSQDQINDTRPVHWTGSSNAISGTVTVDGAPLRFLGTAGGPAMVQRSLEVDALSTTAVFESPEIRLTARFLSPLLAADPALAARPVSYLHLSWAPLDGKPHSVTAKLSCSEELVLNKAGEGRAWSCDAAVSGGAAIRMGSGRQQVLWRSGDDVRIDWGYLYLAVRGQARTGNEVFDDLYAIYAETELKNEALFALGYDDIESLVYFGQPLRGYWAADGKTIETALAEALADYEATDARCTAFSQDLYRRAVALGGEDYAELTALAYRQVMAGHKLARDENGQLLFISKECFSNGCAATVDVTYPSSPLFLYCNPELLKGMLRPIFRYAASDAWKFDFAPHDVGQYPLVNGQVYGNNERIYQMPVEECGNMVILTAAICLQEGSADFARPYLPLLEQWKDYLIRHGEDPGDQLCTDDFAGHMAHNCNLSIKAIMGIAGFSLLAQLLGRQEEADSCMETARRYADSLLRRAANPDGSFRLAFDQPGSYSLKYNAVWDKLWNTGLFPASFFQGEIRRYRQEALPYGVPLDSREKYTKSDWLMWSACLAQQQEDFAFFVHLLWKAYHTMRSRVPMTDWYYADTSEMVTFRHRTVQGGLFLPLLLHKAED